MSRTLPFRFRPLYAKVIAFFAFSAVLLVLLANTMIDDVGGETIAYKARFSQVSGLRAGDDVRVAGVQVGKVTSVAVDPTSQIPMVGASGAIAGVLGAYMVLHPSAPIMTLLPIGLFIELPAWVVTGLWFAIQLISGVGSLGASTGVAFFAHVGGFVSGLLLIRPLHAGRDRIERERWSGWRPPPGSRPRPFQRYRH